MVWAYSQQLPPLDALYQFRPALVSQVFASDGTLIGEYYGEERRYVVPYERIPKQVIHAFVAAEDHTFFEHSGVDFRSIFRALLTNLREQRMAQGGSTITQQVARSFLLTRQKSFERKLIEALLAYRIETELSKERILFLYLNQIYLGEGSYGVKAAARTFFDKELEALTLAEAALLAGLPPAPSRYSPFDNFREARERQKYVLRNMQLKGFITPEQARAAEAEELALVPRRSLNRQRVPHITEYVRRLLVGRFGEDQVYKGGLQVYTTLDVSLQQAAQAAVRAGVERTDKRMGWRGPLRQLPLSDIQAAALAYEEGFKKKQQQARAGGIARFGPPPSGPMVLELGKVYEGIASEVTDRYAVVRVGSLEGILPLENMRWAYKVDPERTWKGRQLDRVTRVMKAGDLFYVKVESLASAKALGPGKRTGRLELSLHQDPELEGGLIAWRLEDRAVLAMVGGYDYERSQFLRPLQAKRQLGSAFKPLIYAAALDHPNRKYTPATMLLDAPVAIDLGHGELWKPDNYDGDYLGEIPLRRALYLSRNTPAVRVMQDLGTRYALQYVKKLGFTSPMEEHYSMVLGTPSVTLLELCRAYTAFADRGQLVEPEFLDKVLDRDGKVLYARSKVPLKTQVMSPSTAYLMTSILQDVVNHGTATKALVLKKRTAGKTGTTNDFVDASYIGFTPQLVAGAWVGFDKPQSMGQAQTGGDVALPLWIDFMEQALQSYPDDDFKVPDDVIFVDVDPDTGRLAAEGSEHRVRLPFKRSRLPEAPPPVEEGQVESADFLSVDEGL